MKAPKIQSTGKKIPKKNIHPCPFLSVISPSVKTRMKYKNAPPIPIPHHMIPPLRDANWTCPFNSDLLGKAAHHPIRTSSALALAFRVGT